MHSGDPIFLFGKVACSTCTHCNYYIRYHNRVSLLVCNRTYIFTVMRGCILPLLILTLALSLIIVIYFPLFSSNLQHFFHKEPVIGIEYEAQLQKAILPREYWLHLFLLDPLLMISWNLS